MPALPRFKVKLQGKVVIERDGQGYLMMFPDGRVEGAPTRAAAEKKARAWFRRQRIDPDAIGVGLIEWRDK